jgi:hypothetical protein
MKPLKKLLTFTMSEIATAMAVTIILIAIAIPAIRKTIEASALNGMPKTITIVAASNGRVMVESTVVTIIESMTERIKWIDAEGVTHEQPLNEHFTYHIASKKPAK